MCDSHMENRDKKGDEDMVKVPVLKTPDTRKAKIYNAIEEVEKIKSGELPRKTARDFLKESRSNYSK